MTCKKDSTQNTTRRLLLAILIIAVGICFSGAPAFAAKALAKPTGVKTAAQDISCEVSWKGVSGATEYQVQYKKASAGKWKDSLTVTEPYAKLTGLNSETKYKVRVRAVNGSKSKWSATKSFTTKLEKPQGMWAKEITAHSITLEWTPSRHAKKYTIKWYQDNPDEYGKDPVVTTKETSYTFDGLNEEGAYTFILQAVNGKKKSPANSILLGTYSEESGCKMELRGYPWDTAVDLTRFISGHDSFPGSEREIPAIYRINRDEKGRIDADLSGYFFPPVYLQRATVYYGSENQYDGHEPAVASREITGETIYQVGSSITMPNGMTAKITRLKLDSLPDEDLYSDCADSDEAYDRVEEYELTVSTDTQPYYLVVSWKPWHMK